MNMFKFKGTRAFIMIAILMLIGQMGKLIHFVHSMELVSFLAVCMTIGLTVKIVFFDRKLRAAKYWILIIFLILQELLIGLDKILPMMYYNIALICMLSFSFCVLYSLDTSSVRKSMDEDAYVLKNGCALLTLTYVIAVSDALLNYMFPLHLPI